MGQAAGSLTRTEQWCWCLITDTVNCAPRRLPISLELRSPYSQTSPTRSQQLPHETQKSCQASLAAMDCELQPCEAPSPRGPLCKAACGKVIVLPNSIRI